eukprot:UN17361
MKMLTRKFQEYRHHWQILGLAFIVYSKASVNTNRKLIFYMIMFFSTCSLFLQKYAVYYLTRPAKNQARRGGRPKKLHLNHHWHTLCILSTLLHFCFSSGKPYTILRFTFDLRSVGMTNCNEVTFPPASRLHAWHIQPPKSTNYR